MEQLTLFAEDGPALTSPWLERVLGWLENDPAFSMSSLVSLKHSLPPGFSWKTFLAFSVAREDGTWASSPRPWPNAAIGGPTGFLTLSISESHSAAGVSSLSDILETDGIPPKYYLSPKACAGILRRAEERGRSLPPLLQAALEKVAGQTTTAPRQDT